MAKESKHVGKFKENHLNPGESILHFSDGYIGEAMGKGDKTQHNGSLIITNKRAVFYRKGIMGEILEGIPINNINSVERVSGMLKHTLSLHGSGNRIVFKGFEKSIIESMASTIEELQSTTKNNIKIDVEKDDNNEIGPFEKIKKLAQLKEIGAITESEFESKKASLLSEI